MRKIFSVIVLCIFIMVSAPFAGAEVITLGTLDNSQDGTVEARTNIDVNNPEAYGWKIDVPFNDDGPYFNGQLRLVSDCDPNDGDPLNTPWEIKEGDTVLYSGIVGGFLIDDENYLVTITLNHDKFNNLIVTTGSVDDVTSTLGCYGLCIDWTVKLSAALTCGSTDQIPSPLIPPEIEFKTPNPRHHSEGTSFNDQVEVIGVNSGSSHPLTAVSSGDIIDALTPAGDYTIYYNYTDAGGNVAPMKTLDVKVVDAPTIVSTSPGNNATNVSVLTVVEAVFSEEMDRNTISSSTFSIVGVDGSVSYYAGTKKAEFSPSGNLAYGTVYTVRLTTDIASTDGATIFDVYEITFQTEEGTPAAPAADGGGGGGGGCFIKTLK